MKKKTALITGIGGMDASHLADYLLEKNYSIVGIIRRNSTGDLENAKHLVSKIDIVEGDITDMSSMLRIIGSVNPHEIYSLAAMSHVHTSFEQPLATIDIDTKGLVNILEVVKFLKPQTRIFHASSISFNTPVLIRYNGNIIRTNVEDSFNKWNNKNENDIFEVFTVDDQGKTCFKNVLGVIDHGFKKVYKITFSGGRDLFVTPDHSLITLKNDVFVETKITEMCKGNFLITFCNNSKNIVCDKRYQKLCWSYSLKRKVGRKVSKIIHTNYESELVLNEDLAYILGMYMAEGCYSKSGRNKKISFIFGNHIFDEKRPSETFALINKYFKYNCSIKNRGSSTTVTACRTNICEFFNKFAGSNSHNKRIPKELYISPKEVKMSFLNGYLGDARISNYEIRYTTVHKDLAIDILWLLRLMGIGGRLHNRYIKPHFSPNNKIIKGSMVWDVIIPKEESWLHENNLPGRKGILAKCLPKDGLSIKIKKNMSRLKLKDLGHFFGDSDIGIEKIQKIEECAILQRVGDFSVEGAEKWFCGVSPILVHNTSEMFGSAPAPQNLNTPLIPQSPYAIAKVASHHFVRLYRQAYKMYICAGATFNHECLFYETPIILKNEDTTIDICYVGDLIQNKKDVSKDTSTFIKKYDDTNIQVWDGFSFVKLKTISRKKLNNLDLENQFKHITNTPHGITYTTPNHKLCSFTNNEKIEAKCFSVGNKLLHGKFPDNYNSICSLSEDMAKLYGMLCADGYVKDKIRFTNNNKNIQDEFIKTISKCFCNISIKKSSYVSGFKGTTTHLDVSGISSEECNVIRNKLYNYRTKHKKVPTEILNSSNNIKSAFLEGYYLGDGQKTGNGDYKYKSFKTNSPLLAQGLLYLCKIVLPEQDFCLCSFEQNNKIYTHVNLNTPNIERKNLGSYFKKDRNTISKIIKKNEVNQHVFDIETESGFVCAGVGNVVISNSPRRGPNFVTRKITMAVAKCLKDTNFKLKLGNLDCKRDWGYAPDFVEGFWMTLQQENPDDYIFATGETHSVMEFCELAFSYVGLDWKNHVIVDRFFMRPAEVPELCGDYSETTKKIGWEPKIKFEELIKIMVDYDCKLLNGEK